MRRVASQLPFAAPYFCNASRAYCEQVGVYLHDAGVNGETVFWYTVIAPVRIRASIAFPSR